MEKSSRQEIGKLVQDVREIKEEMKDLHEIKETMSKITETYALAAEFFRKAKENGDVARPSSKGDCTRVLKDRMRVGDVKSCFVFLNYHDSADLIKAGEENHKAVDRFGPKEKSEGEEYEPTPEEHKILDQSEREFEDGKQVTQGAVGKRVGLMKVLDIGYGSQPASFYQEI